MCLRNLLVCIEQIYPVTMIIPMSGAQWRHNRQSQKVRRQESEGHIAPNGQASVCLLSRGGPWKWAFQGKLTSIVRDQK